MASSAEPTPFPVDAPAPTAEAVAAGAPFAVTVSAPGGGEVTLELDADHRLWVSRPAAVAGGIRMPAERYEWKGGVPSPDEPRIPHTRGYDADDLAWKDPILGVTRANATNQKESADQRAEAKRLWAYCWDAMAPHLDPRAARLSATYEYAAELYQILHTRPDLCDHLEVCPALGPFLTPESARQIPPVGWSLAQIAGHLVTPASAETPTALAPGFLAWARGLQWDGARLPQFPKAEDRRIPAIKGFIRSAAKLGTAIDHNGVHKLADDDEWLVLNLAIANPAATFLVPAILKNPAGAFKSIQRFFPPDMRIPKRDKIEQVFTIVIDWYRAESLRRQTAKEKPLEISGFNRMCEEARLWDRVLRGQELEQANALADERARKQAEQDEIARQARERAQRLLREARERGAVWHLAGDIDPMAPFPNPPEIQEWQDDQYRIVYHPNGAALQEESLLMGHCVVTHAPNCVRGNEYVFSVRRVADPHVPIATIALNKSGGVKEARGPGNAKLNEELAAWTRRTAKRLFGTRHERGGARRRAAR